MVDGSVGWQDVLLAEGTTETNKGRQGLKLQVWEAHYDGDVHTCHSCTLSWRLLPGSTVEDHSE